MSYDDQIARICRLENGFEVEIYDPLKKTPKERPGTVPFQDPWKSYAFGTTKEVMKFLSERIDKLSRKSADVEYADAFKEATDKE